jgi:chloramphenicol 3-O phosphotransferase
VETTPGRIVILNGAPRSGKSSIAAALAEMVPGAWINLGVDTYNRAMPKALLPGIGLRPGGERPDLEPLLPTLYAALYESIAAHARSGLDVVADLGHHDDYSRPLGTLPQCAKQLAGLPVLFVGVHCPVEVVLERRRSDPQDGFYTIDEAMVRRWDEAVHRHGLYDLTVDTGAMTPAQCAEAIVQALKTPPVPSAFERLAAG